MRATYDEEADAAYIYLVDAISPGLSKRQAVVETEGLRSMVVFDFDEDDRLLGIEVINARASLRDETIDSFKKTGRAPGTDELT